LAFYDDPTLLATSIIIIVTVIGIIWSGILTRESNQNTVKSNELMEQDLELRHRPWLSIGNPEVSHFTNNEKVFKIDEMEKMTFEEHKSLNITHIDWNYTLKNTGLTPAKNIVFKTLNSNNELTEKNSKDAIIIQEKSTLMPSQESIHTHVENIDDWSDDTSENWFMIIFEYEFVNHKQEIQKNSTGRILKFHNAEWEAMSSW